MTASELASIFTKHFPEPSQLDGALSAISNAAQIRNVEAKIRKLREERAIALKPTDQPLADLEGELSSLRDALEPV